MKRRYKLLLIIFIGAMLTIFINNLRPQNKINLVSLGDGFSLGMTPYNVAGYSFNDYLKEELLTKQLLGDYNNEFSLSHLTIHELNEYMDKNVYGNSSKIPIKQTLDKADIVTIAIGVDELADLSLQGNINSENINKYITEMSRFLTNLRSFYTKKIIIIGIYPAYKLDKKDVIEINDKLKKLCGKYQAVFYDCLGIALNAKYYLTNNSCYFNYEAHKIIANELLKQLAKN